MNYTFLKAILIVGVFILLLGNFTSLDYEFWLWWYSIGFVVWLAYAKMRAPKYKYMNPERTFDVIKSMVIGMSVWPLVLIILITMGRDKDRFED